jgi:hypothetical protein
MASRSCLSTIALIVCLACPQWSAALFAAEPDPPAVAAAPASASTAPGAFTVLQLSRFSLPDDAVARDAQSGAPRLLVPDESVFAQRWGRGRWRRDHGARTAMFLGATAAIAGAAVLVYANRPDCRTNPAASGCGYGTKVIGGAVLAGGAAGLVIGALSWR